MIKITKKQLAEIQKYSKELKLNYPKLFLLTEDRNLSILTLSMISPPQYNNLYFYNQQLNTLQMNLMRLDYMLTKFNLRLGIHSQSKKPHRRYGSLEKLPGAFSDLICFTPKYTAKDDLEKITLDLFLAASEEILKNTSTRRKK